MQHSTDSKVRNNAARPRNSISLVLPAWNEAAAIGQAIAEADAALRNLVKHYEIIVVDDGSVDETATLVQQVAATNPAVRLVRHDTNRGYGAAIRSGFAVATCELIVFTDADHQFALEELDRFLLLSKQYQIVCGYRIDRQDSPLRCFYSRVYNLLAGSLLRTGVRDVDCALKMFHRDVIQDLPITTDGFLVNSELLSQASQRRYSIVEVGVSHRPRTQGESTVSIAHIPTVLASLIRYWWNRVQFPGGDARASDALEPTDLGRIEQKGLRWGPVLLLFFAAALLLTRLAYPLIDRDETRYAEIPREMVETGNWILPQLNFEPYYDKPVLLYWLCAASYSVFGVSEWSARLVAPMCGMATLVATLWFGSRMFGKRVGLMATAVLLLSVGFLGTSRLLLIDGLLALGSTVALFAGYEAMRTSTFRLGWWLTASIACGAAFLTKGPVALVLFIPPVLAFGWLAEGIARPRMRHWLMLAGVVTVIAAPWFIAVSIQDPQFAYEFFYKHNITRFAGAYHARPFWYFLPVLMIAGHPWTFLTIPYAGFLISHAEPARQKRPRPLGFLLLWSAWCFTFFSISKCKLPTYILPAAPAMALMIGHYLQQVLFSADESWLLNFARKWAPWLAAACTCLAGAAFGLFSLLADFDTPVVAWSAVASWAIALAAIFYFQRRQPSARVGWSVCLAAGMLLAIFVLHREIPQYAQAQTVFGPGSPLLAKLSEAERLPIVTLAHEWSGIPFGLKRNDITQLDPLDSFALRRIAAENSRVLFVLRKNADVTALRNQLPVRTRLSTVAQRGPAQLIMATIEPGYENVARTRDLNSDRR